MRERVNEMLSILLNVEFGPEDSVEREATPKWDSLKHVELVFLLEDEFDIQISEDDMSDLTSTDKVVAYLSAHGHS